MLNHFGNTQIGSEVCIISTNRIWYLYFYLGIVNIVFSDNGSILTFVNCWFYVLIQGLFFVLIIFSAYGMEFNVLHMVWSSM